MFLLRLVREFGKLLRGGAGTRDIFLGGLLGVLIGMIPGINLSLFLALFLLLILNANVGIALFGFVLGKALCLILQPVTFQIGYTLIHQIGLEGLFRVLSDTPVFALLNLHVYCLTGGLPIALIIGSVFGLAVALFIRGARMGIIAAASRSEKVRKAGQNKFVRFLLWLAFGPQKKELAEILKRKSPLFCRKGLALSGLLVILFVVLEFFFLNTFVKATLESELSAANGAEVNLGSVHLSLLGGEFSLQNIQVGDPEKPTHNLFQAGEITADLGVLDLLAKRYAMDLLKVSNVDFDVERAKPARVYRKEKEEAEEAEKEEPEDSLNRIFEKIEWVKEHLKKLKEYLERRKAEEEGEKEEEKAEEEKEGLMERGRNHGYLGLSAKNFAARHPTWLIRKIIVDGIAFAREGEPQKLEGSDLSSHPELHQKPMELKLSSSKGDQTTALLALHFEAPDALHRFQVNFRDIALGDSIRLSHDAPLDVQEGKARINADGQFSAGKLDIPFTVVVENLKAKVREGRPVLGLDPKTAQEIFRVLEQIEITGLLTGSLESPRVQLDEKEILSSLKDALLKAGKEELARRANEQLEKWTEKLSEKAKEALGEKLEERIPGKVKEILKDKVPKELDKLLPGFGKKKEKKEK